MSLPAPVLPIVGPLVGAIAVLLLGRWPRLQSIVGVLVAIILAGWIATLSPDSTDTTSSSQNAIPIEGSTWLLVGRRLLLTAGLQDFLVFLFVGFGLLFLVSLPFPQGPTFVPAGLAALSPLAALLLVQLTAFAAILLIIAITLLLMSYQPQVPQKTMGALRYLLLFLLTLPLFLLIGWLFESGPATLLSPLMVAALAMAIAMVLAGFPFYIWVYPIVAEAPLLIPALIFGLGQTVVIAFVFSLLQANVWLTQNTQFLNWLRWSSVGTVLIAALLILVAGRWRFLLGHLLLLNMGMSILALTLPQPQAWNVALLAHISRFLSLLLAASALSLLQRYRQDDTIAASRGLGKQLPLIIALLAYACFSLLGTPLTIGFPAQWAMITSLGQQTSIWLTTLLVLALALSVYGVLRVMVILFEESDKEQVVTEPNWQRAVVAVILLLAILIALFPQPFLAQISQMTTALNG